MKNEKETAGRIGVSDSRQKEQQMLISELKGYVTSEELRQGQPEYEQEEACHEMKSKRQAGSEHPESCWPR